MRRAKIVCTLGPATANPVVLEGLVAGGMDVARLNFSHGTHEVHRKTIDALRATTLKVRRPVAILADLQGPKIRTGLVQNNGIELVTGSELVLTTEQGLLGTPELVSTTYEYLAADAKPGDHILLDDGLLELEVLETDGAQRIRTKVLVGGILKNNKGINLPGVNLRTAALTEKDREDLEFALKSGVELVALSFVRSADDVLLCRKSMEQIGRVVPIIAKLEKPEAVRRLDEILDVTDGVMVARGDLGVEIPPEEVPTIQKLIIRKANAKGLPVIVATQMLNSMIEHPRPTRAEASDVANAIFDHADAVMLSGETASGKYPLESLAMMTRIVAAAESAPQQPTQFEGSLSVPAEFPDAISRTACRAALDCDATAIVAFTLTGTTARLLSRYRPNVPIIAFSPNQEVRRRLNLLWGVIPRVLEPVQEIEQMVSRVEEEILARGSAKRGDRIVIVFGAPIGQQGKTNSIRLHTIQA